MPELEKEQMTYLELIEKQEQQDFRYEDLVDVVERFNYCKMDRQLWDVECKKAHNIQTGDLVTEFADKILGDNANKNILWGENYLANDIKTSIAALEAATLKVRLKNERGTMPKSQRLLEAKLNFSIDKFNVIRKTSQALWDWKFTGMAYSAWGWNPYDNGEGWITGKPEFFVVDPRLVWIDPTSRELDRSDMEYNFRLVKFKTETLKRQYPEFAEKIVSMTMAEDYEDTDNPLSEYTDVIVYCYKKEVPIKRRAIINEVEDGFTTRYYTEKEYEDYLTEISGRELSPTEMQDLKALGQDEDDDTVIPEGMVVSDTLESHVPCWFQVVIIPDMMLQLTKPEYMGSRSPITVLSGTYNPNQTYWYGQVYENYNLLEASLALKTLALFHVLKLNRPIVIIPPGSILNEDEVRENWGDPNLIITPNPAWFQLPENAGKKPEDIITVIELPELSNAMVALANMLESAIDRSTNSPDVAKGIPTHSQQSGKQTALLQQAVAQSGRVDYFSYQEFIRMSCEVLKEMLARYVTYSDELYMYNMRGEKEIIGLNRKNDPETMIAEAVNSKCVVKLEENADLAKFNEEQKMTQLYQAGAITYTDWMHSLNLQNADELIRNKEEESGRAELDLLMQIPEVQQMLSNVMQSPEVQQKLGELKDEQKS